MNNIKEKLINEYHAYYMQETDILKSDNLTIEEISILIKEHKKRIKIRRNISVTLRIIAVIFIGIIFIDSIISKIIAVAIITGCVYFIGNTRKKDYYSCVERNILIPNLLKEDIQK